MSARQWNRILIVLIIPQFQNSLRWRGGRAARRTRSYSCGTTPRGKPRPGDPRPSRRSPAASGGTGEGPSSSSTRISRYDYLSTNLTVTRNIRRVLHVTGYNQILRFENQMQFPFGSFSETREQWFCVVLFLLPSSLFILIVLLTFIKFTINVFYY